MAELRPQTLEINYEIFNPRMESLIRKLGQLITAALPKGWGFNLLLFEFGKDGSLFYISDAAREDVVNVMREYIAKHEAQQQGK